MKGHVSGHGNRARPYGLLLVLAFGAAILGVLVLHKLRERRIFNLIVKEKDTDLISLRLLLQKERDQNKEMKRKTEAMRAKIYSLRTQKGELDSRILEMRSTISSLKDEQRVIELALEEKERDIKMLHDREKNSGKEDPQVLDLTERLKQKEVEIKDLKRHLQYPARVWSVSTDDPSKGMVLKDAAETTEIKGKIGRSHESTESGENSTTGAEGNGNEDRRENRVGIADREEMVGEYLQNLEAFPGEELGDGNNSTEKSTDEVSQKITEHSLTDSFGVAKGNNNANATEAIGYGGEISKTREDISDVMDGTEHETAAMGQLEKLSVQDSEDGQLGENSEGGMKLEISGNSQTGAAGYRVRHKHSHAGKTKGKEGRKLVKKYESNDEMNTEGRKPAKNVMGIQRYNNPVRDGEPEKLDRHHSHHMGFNMKEEFRKENVIVDASDKHQENRMEMKFRDLGGSEEREEGTDGTNLVVNSTDIKLPKPQNLVENASIKVGDTITNQEIGRHEMDVQYEKSERLHQTAETLLITDGTASDAGEQKMGEIRVPERQASAVQHEKARREVEKAGNDSESAKVADKYEHQEEDLEAADIQEARKETIEESMSSSEEEKEDYKEQTEEPEF